MDLLEIQAFGGCATNNLVEKGRSSNASWKHVSSLVKQSSVIAYLKHLDLHVLVLMLGFDHLGSGLEVDQVSGVVFDDDEDLAVLQIMN